MFYCFRLFYSILNVLFLDLLQAPFLIFITGVPVAASLMQKYSFKYHVSATSSA